MVDIKKIAVVLYIMLACGASLYSEEHSIKNLQMFGNSAVSIGRAGAGVSSIGNDLFYLNPASIAALERISAGVNYGTMQGGVINPDVQFALPTSYGVLGGTLRYFKLDASAGITNGYSLSIGAAKEITERLYIGLAFNFFYGSDGKSLFYIGGTPGVIYKFDESARDRGFGFFNPKLGVAVNIGVPVADRAKNVNFNSPTIGLSSEFYRHKYFTVGFLSDVSALNYASFTGKFGLESEIVKKYTVRAGTALPLYSLKGSSMKEYGYGLFTFGLGYKIYSSDTFELEANYAFSLGDAGMIHYIGVSGQYGTLDREPPVTRIRKNYTYISPNHDGIRDYVIFRPEVEDASRIKGWKLQVLDSDNRVVKEFAMSERDIIQGLTVSEFFRHIIQKKESLAVPEKIMWDGTDKDGKTVPDGKYTYAFNAWDERNNIAAVKTGVVYVDNTPPMVKLKNKEDLFSPNGDKQKDEFIIEQEIKTDSSDIWNAGFKDASGKVVKKYTWKGTEVPKKVIWDGRNDSGGDATEGLYYYFINSKDRAGNSASAEIREITLTRQYETADITAASKYFSFLIGSELQLFPRLSNTKGIESWKIIITGEDNKPVREITGEKNFPAVVIWDVLNNEGQKLDDGVYGITLETKFQSGNTPKSFTKKIIVDSTPPEIKSSHTPALFSPDNDGENDILTIRTSAYDKNGIRDWKIIIYAPDGSVFKTFSGKETIPEEIVWDGLGENRDIVESAADYFIEVEATDNARNTAVSAKDKVMVDILVIVTERGLKMRISNIEFAFASAKIVKKGTAVLNRVAEILEKYGKYNVVIEGHTDDIGEEDYNLKLSEKRARAVMTFLVERGIPAERLKFTGMGETTPLYPNTTEENRRRNRRVEFLLIKKTE